MGSLNKAIEILICLFKIHVSAKRLYTSINASRHILLRPNANITRRPCVVTCPAIWIRLGTMVKIDKKYLVSPWHINDAAVEKFAKCLVDALNMAKKWLDETEGEFILDPDYYGII